MKKTIFLLTLATCILTFIINSYDPDLWARFAVGSIFFQTGNVLKHDIFAYTATKNLWIDHEWGAGVIFYFFAQHFGQWGIYFLKSILIFIIFIFIIKINRLQTGKKHGMEILYLALIGLSAYPSMASTIRSQIFTFVFFMLWIYILEKAKRGENRQLWILPATMLLWVNMHGGFITGLGLLIIYAVGEFLNKKNPVKYLAVLAATLPVTLINPYKLKYWYYIIEAVTMPRPGIDEWKPISLSDPHYIILGIPVHIFAGFALLVIMTLVAGLKAWLDKSKPDWVKILLFFILIYLGFSHKRHAILFILSVAGLFYTQHINLFICFEKFIKDKFGEKTLHYLQKVKKLINCTILIWACLYVLIMPKSLIVSPDMFPVGSIQFIKQNNLSGNVLTTYRWGNYVLWKLYPKCLVSVDGRYEEIYPNSVFDMGINFTKHLNDNWSEILNKFHADIIIAPKVVYTKADLIKLKNWNVIYEDAVSYLLLPSDKIRKIYIIPNFMDTLYWHENLSKKVDLN